MALWHPGTPTPLDLLADRFVVEPIERVERDARAGGSGAPRWRDLATGRRVRVRIVAAGSRASQLAWSDRCAAIARLKHPALNDLIDFGSLGRDHVFEAYDADRLERPAEARAPCVAEHARTFLQAQAPHVDRETMAFVVRRADSGARRRRVRRPLLGIVLQPRRVFAAIEDALAEGSPGGVTALDIAGPPGSGLTTVRLYAARTARLNGYVPVSNEMLRRDATLIERLRGRHICLIVTALHSSAARSALAAFVAQLGAESARRHLLLRFGRLKEQYRGTIEVDPMSGERLANMLYVENDRPPDRDAVRTAARESGGWPGVFLDRLGAMRWDRHPSGVSIARETAPAYLVSPPPAPRRGIGRVLLDAAERGATLARRGRHASAVRLLTRAGRVLEARHERGLAGACAEQLGWIERARGRSERAQSAFAHARALGSDGAPGVRGALGAGIVWTDEVRFAEAEAALRGAATAAALLSDDDLERRSRRALARCLYWQRRYDEAQAVLEAAGGGRDSEVHDAEEDALRARIAIAQKDLRLAIVSASRALDLAERIGNDQVVASAARSMALAQAALGSGEQVRRWVRRGVQAAARGHLPLMTLRLRAIELRSADPDDRAAKTIEKSLRTVLRRRGLPALVRGELETACDRSPLPSDMARSSSCDRTLHDLEGFLTLLHGEADDAGGLGALCGTLAEMLRAATVQIDIGSPAPRLLARAGRPWQGDLAHIDRMLAGGPVPSDALGASRHAAEAIRFGQDAIAVLSCRWTPGAIVDRAAATARLKAAALAAAPSVRSLLDRSHTAVADGVAGELIGASPAAVSLRDAIARAARAPFPVLIEGESGSGKELVARAVHKMGSRRDRRLCALNCAALADDLLEAELFGHARGAFTGAVGERPGLFEEADGGTLFLDEVGELSARAQAKLLRVLQDGEVRRVGENLPRRVDARIIAATNRRLGDEVDAGRFRADLRFRLDVVRLVVPPLRDRAGDIPVLAAQFWSEAAGRVGSGAALTGDTLAALARYDWPGNVRELQNAIASMAVHAPRRGRVVPSMLPAHIARAARPDATSFEAAREDFERRYVRAALAQAAGHRSRAARALGVSRQGLAKMLRRLRIDD